MNSIKKLMTSLFMFIASTAVLADSLTDMYPNYLMNAQVHQVDRGGGMEQEISIGYYRFDGQGGVTHMRFEIRPSMTYTNTRIDAKHINTAIRDIYNLPCLVQGCHTGAPADHSLEQECIETDMGNMFRPTMDYASNSGTYTFNGTNLTIFINGVETIWRAAGPERWELVDLSFIPIRDLIYNFKGFAYFSEGAGPSPISFKDDFYQGDLCNNRSAYTGKVFSSHRATGPDVWLGNYESEFAFRGLDFSNESHDGKTYENQFGYIWFYDLKCDNHLQIAKIQNSLTEDPNNSSLDESKGAMVQNSLYTNYYSSFPTLMIRNTGHIYHTFSQRGDETPQAFNSRRCWTKSDSIRTQGHIWLYLGAWDGGKVSNMVILEVMDNKNPYYPTISLGYGEGP